MTPGFGEQQIGLNECNRDFATATTNSFPKIRQAFYKRVEFVFGRGFCVKAENEAVAEGSVQPTTMFSAIDLLLHNRARELHATDRDWKLLSQRGKTFLFQLMTYTPQYWVGDCTCGYLASVSASTAKV